MGWVGHRAEGGNEWGATRLREMSVGLVRGCEVVMVRLELKYRIESVWNRSRSLY